MAKKSKPPRPMPTEQGEAESDETLIDGTETLVIPVVLTPQELEIIRELADAQEVEPSYLVRQWVLDKIYTS